MTYLEPGHPLERRSEIPPDEGAPSRTTTRDTPLTVHVVALESMNFAMVHNSVPLVRELAVTNRGPNALEALEVTVELSHYARPWSGAIPRLGVGATHHFEDLVFEYDEQKLLNTVELDKAHLEVCVDRVTEAGERASLVRQSQPVSILAYNEWRRDIEPHMLASFVLPNHPDVQQVLEQARQVLGRATGNPAMDGYQSKDPGRVLAVARAIYESIGGLKITYASPPASFEETGQKIRTPEQILGGKTATCIDVSVLIAAALEQVGLHPHVVLVDGHAFPGVWLHDDFRGDGGFSEVASLRNELRLGSLEVFDSSAAVLQPAVPFEQAVAEARRILEDDDAFRFALDVRGARSLRYRPLPSRVCGSEFAAVREVHVRTPAPAPVFARVDKRAENELDSSPEDPPEVLEAKARLRLWQKQLLDLTLRNRLLNFYPDGRHGVKVMCPDLPRLEDHLAAGSSFVLHGRAVVFSQEDARSARIRRAQTGEEEDAKYLSERIDEGVLHCDLPADREMTALRKLERKGRESFEEAGAHTIFLALGLLRWFEAPSSQVERFAPVLLVPVQLRRGSALEPWNIQASDESTVFNPSLIEKLNTEFGIDLSEFGDELPGDDSGVDVPLVFDRVRKAIRSTDRWELKEEAHLGHFSFTKLVMWRDLDHLVRHVGEKPLLRAVARKGREPFPTGDGVPSEPELDAKFPPGNVFCPMDADSSQLAAVLAAAGGENFVLQGPPGTGKSQTITNLITHCLAVGKTVLFVSAKMAALQVVHRRLKRVGMGPFCLELHSHASNKKAVLEQLSLALHAVPQSPPDWEDRVQSLARDRQRLNCYVNALHRPRPQGMTLREGMGALCRLRHTPAVRLELGPAARLSRRDLKERVRVVSELAAQARRIGPMEKHPLAHVQRTTWTPDVQDSFEGRLRRAKASVAMLTSAVVDVGSMLDKNLDGATLAELDVLRGALEALSDPGDLCSNMLTVAEPSVARESALSFVSLGRERDTIRSHLDSAYSDAFHYLNLDQIAERLRTWGTVFFLIAFFMLWRTRRLLRSVRTAGPLPRYSELLVEVEEARKLRRLEERFDAQAPTAKKILGPEVQRGADWQQLEDRAQRTFALRHHLDAVGGIASLGGPSSRNRLVQWFQQDLNAHGPGSHTRDEAVAAGQRLQEALEKLTADLTALTSCLDLDPNVAWNGPRASRTSIESAITGLEAGKTSLRDWALYQAIRARLASVPEFELVAALERGELNPDDLEKVFERAYQQAWVSAEYQGDSALSVFDSASHEQVVERFRQDDAAYSNLAADRAGAILASQIPRGGEGEMAVLHRELKKQRRHLPIRQLFQRIPTVRRRLKPCLLMSPLSVAQYLNPTDRFDIVIFDEASQLPTADAVGTIARGEQLIVVGDSKQLPPTSFFERSIDEESVDEESGDELESILDECVASQMRELQLRWHYRSQHEHLIAFSNHYYYDNQLNTFASADDRGGRLGVKLLPVLHAHYDKGKSRTNRGEAEALVAEVVRRLRDPGEQKRSLGIVTFSVAQQQLVEDLLEGQRTKFPEIEPFFSAGVLEPVFVKNLENVQGDERDVILFSICYGPDEHGRLSMNFGPLNKQGGERRLNVAVTRARQQLMVFSTLRADQIDLRRTRAVGVKHLRRFLAYAERGPSAIAEAVDTGGELQFDSPFEEEVYEALRHRGYEVLTQVGCSGYRIDLAIVDPEQPGRMMLGIECDGAAYHSAKTARDRDRLREAVLRSLGWRIHRIWSTDWWTQPESVLERLEQAIAEARVVDPAGELSGANAEWQKLEVASSEDVEVPERVANAGNKGITPPPPPVANVGEPYRVARIRPDISRHVLDDPRGAPLLAEDIGLVIQAEAPVHFRVLASRLSDRWGSPRITQRILGYLANIIHRYSLGVTDGDFIWQSQHQIETYDKVRCPTGESQRKIEEIPVQELMAAGRGLLRANLSIEQENLVRSIARTFGIQRVGSRVGECIEEAIRRLVAAGEAVENNGNIGLPE